MRIGDGDFVVRVADGSLTVDRGTAEQSDDVQLAADLETMATVLKGRYELAPAIKKGALTCIGDRDAATRLIRSLGSPRIVSAPRSRRGVAV
jgi:alkyl sulfatase BDS1-like metallo-beta-lactamase superfamily hydrolase